MKLIKFIKEHVVAIAIVLFVATIGILFFCRLTSIDVSDWFKKPFSNITVGDILIIALIHAWINGRNNK